MREVSGATMDAWRAEAKTGDRASGFRATISRFRLKRFPYDTAWAAGSSEDLEWANMKQRTGFFTSFLFGGDQDVREIKNLRGATWERGTDQDVATCTLTLLNSELTPIGNQERTEHAEDFDMPGFFVYNRGEDGSVEKWGFEETGWEEIFIPDRIVKTYEGYGHDDTRPPGLDENLYPAGVWLIDNVRMNRAGDMVLTMRDIGKLLLEQICFPPVIPYAEYPLEWSRLRTEEVLGREPNGGTWSARILDEGSASSSNDAYVDDWSGLEDPGTDQPYVGPGGGVWGHQARDATLQVANGTADDEDLPYWLSTGQSTRRSKVWWQFDFDDARSVSALRLAVVGGPYRIYVSVQDSDGNWKGRREVPYDVTTKDVDLHADVKFVKTDIADRGRVFDVLMPKVFHDIKAVRVTFTRLWDTQTSDAFAWRAGLRSVQIYRNAEGDDGSGMGFEPGSHLSVVGNYRDYTDIIKWVCCWGGFFWPGHNDEDGGGETREDYVRLGWVGPAGGMINLKRWVRWDTPDPRIPSGRAWGDFMATGTHGEADLTLDLFDKQPLMDVISYVRDIVGFLFFVDELGGAIWRMPNIFKKGNYLSPTTLGGHTRARTSQIITIDESTELLDYQVTVDGENNREVIFVANLTGSYGSAIEGYAPADARMRRTAGWTDQNFKSKRETRVMADMIATQQMFNYRKGSVTIYGCPAIQIDDQIRIYERTTNEFYYHYVTGISASWDAKTGEYIYTLQTHWLGESQEKWALDTTLLSGLTQTYLEQLGVEQDDNGIASTTEDEGTG